MGQEIGNTRFKKQDFEAFERRLRAETEQLQRWFDDRAFSRHGHMAGFELEAWLVDRQAQPAPVNEAFLAAMDDEALVTPELSQFNIELNSTPEVVVGDVFRRMESELALNWSRCRRTAHGLDADLLMIGILPTLRESVLSLENMSRMARYKALNEQVLRMRGGRPISLDIQGEEHLHTEHGDVMLEAATTSFQMHLQVGQAQAARYYNAMQILSAPMVAVTGNSPFLFGRRLWRETRIPLFEQAVAVGGFNGAAFGPVRRVSFGTGYVRESIMSLFRENLEHYPPLLPVQGDEPEESLFHVRLHNGTIWRWNRPLLGFDADGTPHLRIEHRVVPAGPSVVDAIANLAFFFGLAFSLAEEETPPETRLEFGLARENFYAAAKHGLAAPATWLDGQRGTMRELILHDLLPRARRALVAYGVERADVEAYLGIIEARTENGMTGAAWQIAHYDRHRDFAALVHDYLIHQDSSAPVHRWDVD